jgi:hypothetical protein
MINGYNFNNEEFLIITDFEWNSKHYGYYYDDEDVAFNLDWNHVPNSNSRGDYAIDMKDDDMLVLEGPTIESVMRQMLRSVFE